MINWYSGLLMIASELAHWSAAVPLVACGILTWRRQDPGPIAWWLAIAFGVSVVADSVAAQVGGPNAWVGYLFVPAQMAVLLGFLLPPGLPRMTGWIVLAVFAAVSLLRGPWDRQETIIEVVGGALVWLLAVALPTSYRRAVRITWGLTIPMTLGMLLLPVGSASWVACWLVFQGLRLAGVVAWGRGVASSLRASRPILVATEAT